MKANASLAATVNPPTTANISGGVEAVETTPVEPFVNTSSNENLSISIQKGSLQDLLSQINSTPKTNNTKKRQIQSIESKIKEYESKKIDLTDTEIKDLQFGKQFLEKINTQNKWQIFTKINNNTKTNWLSRINAILNNPIYTGNYEEDFEPETPEDEAVNNFYYLNAEPNIPDEKMEANIEELKNALKTQINEQRNKLPKTEPELIQTVDNAVENIEKINQKERPLSAEDKKELLQSTITAVAAGYSITDVNDSKFVKIKKALTTMPNAYITIPNFKNSNIYAYVYEFKKNRRNPIPLAKPITAKTQNFSNIKTQITESNPKDYKKDGHIYQNVYVLGTDDEPILYRVNPRYKANLNTKIYLPFPPSSLKRK